MKKIIFLFMIGFCTLTNAQEEQFVTLTVIGQGKSKDEAKQVALQNAIEQTYGNFISSKKEIISNKATRDELVLASNGNIKQDDIISEIEIPHIGFVVTLKVIVSITKLKEFSESKGEVVEFKGGLFSQKIKIQKLNEEAENTVIKNLCLTSFEILKNSVDFELKYSSPVVIGDITDSYDNTLSDYKFDSKFGYYLNEYKPEDFIVKFTVNTKHNNNYFVFLDYFKKTIASLTMASDEIDDYKNLNKKVLAFKIDDKFYYLRNNNSMENLYNFFIKSNIIPITFKIVSNNGEINCLLKNRNRSTTSTILGIYDKQNDYENHSFINVRSVYYDSYRSKTNSIDWFMNKSVPIFKSSNIYPYYEDLFKSVYVEDNNSRNDSTIDPENKNNEPTNFLFLNTKEIIENSFPFYELFTLNEIEKIDFFQVKQYDLIEVLKKEEERLKSVKLVKLDGGGFEPYEDFFGNKYNNYETLIGNGTIANFIEVQKDKVLVKIYRTRCSIDSFCDQGNPGKLYYIPVNKVLKHLNANEFKDKNGEVLLGFN